MVTYENMRRNQGGAISFHLRPMPLMSTGGPKAGGDISIYDIIVIKIKYET